MIRSTGFKELFVGQSKFNLSPNKVKAIRWELFFNTLARMDMLRDTHGGFMISHDLLKVIIKLCCKSTAVHTLENLEKSPPIVVEAEIALADNGGFQSAVNGWWDVVSKMCSDVDQVATQAFKNDMAALAIRLLALGRAELKEYIDRECSTCGVEVLSSVDVFRDQKTKLVQNLIDLFQRQRPKFDFAIILENADEATKMNLFEQRLKQMMIPDAASSSSEIAPPTEADSILHSIH